MLLAFKYNFVSRVFIWNPEDFLVVVPWVQQHSPGGTRQQILKKECLKIVCLEDTAKPLVCLVSRVLEAGLCLWGM